MANALILCMPGGDALASRKQVRQGIQYVNMYADQRTCMYNGKHGFQAGCNAEMQGVMTDRAVAPCVSSTMKNTALGPTYTVRT